MRCLKSTSKHILNNSSGEEIYDNATVIYQTALISSGYYVIFTYTKIPISFNKVSKRKTKPKNFCFNPPFTNNVKAKVGKMFFKFLKTHFPRNHKLCKVFHKSTVKISYNSSRNMESVISAHN